jgi:hypothetical protein
MTQLFNQDKFEQFQAAYEQAKNENKTSFTFEGKEFSVTYAKYLIQYLENNYE